MNVFMNAPVQTLHIVLQLQETSATSTKQQGSSFNMAQTNSFYLKDDNNINKAATTKTRLSATTGHLQQETWPAQS